jgi:hypothetical protein
MEVMAGVASLEDPIEVSVIDFINNIMKFTKLMSLVFGLT